MVIRFHRSLTSTCKYSNGHALRSHVKAETEASSLGPSKNHHIGNIQKIVTNVFSTYKPGSYIFNLEKKRYRLNAVFFGLITCISV